MENATYKILYNRLWRINLIDKDHIQPWCEVDEEYQVVIKNNEYGNTFSSMDDADYTSDQLNRMFSEHNSWNLVKAKATSIEYLRCKMCGERYIPGFDASGNEHCSHCGRGKLDFAIMTLDNKGGHNDRILQEL